MSESRYTTLLLLAATSLLVACAPPKSTMPGVATESTSATAPNSDLEQHQLQVEQDAQAFLEFQRTGTMPEATQTAGTPATEGAPIIEWNRQGTTAGDTGTVAATPQPTADSTDRIATDPNERTATTTEVASDTTDDLQRSMIDFARVLYTDSTWSDQPMKELLVLASMSMLDPDRAIDPDAIPDLTEEERELLAAMQAWFTLVGRELDSDGDPWKVLIAASDQLQKRLKRIPDLKLPAVALCTRVGGFGDYDEWNERADDEAYNFIAHQGQPVIIYAEMEGFQSKLNDRDLWETITSQHLTIYSDRDGIPVWNEDWQTAADRSQNRRRDYFTVQKLTLPSGLSVGKYRLKLRVRDEKSGAEVERSIPFTMTAGVLD